MVTHMCEELFRFVFFSVNFSDWNYCTFEMKIELHDDPNILV